MKKLPRTRVVALLTVLAIIALLAGQGCVSVSVPSFGNLTQAFFGLVLEDPQKITSKELFEKALSEVQHSGVSYRFQIDDGPLYSYGPDVKIQSKTVVTKKAATSGGMHPMTPSLTHHIYSVNSNDVTTVSKEIVPQ